MLRIHEASESIPPGGYLASRLLVATPLVDAPAFARSVVLMVMHDHTGAMGIIINHKIENVAMKDLFEQLSISPHHLITPIPVHYGGPLEMHRGFVIYAIEETVYPDTLLTIGDIGVSSSLPLLQEIARGGGPRKSLLALGYAGWAPGQLEVEMEQNAWISVPATHELIFSDDTPAKWQHCAEVYGIDIQRITSTVGHA